MQINCGKQMKESEKAIKNGILLLMRLLVIFIQYILIRLIHSSKYTFIIYVLSMISDYVRINKKNHSILHPSIYGPK